MQTIFLKTLAPLLWLALWQGAHVLVGSELLLPSPTQVALQMLAFLGEGTFYNTILHSFTRIFSGFMLGVLAGCAIAVATAFSPIAHSFFSLPMNIIKATPVASFVILALVWISGQNLSVFIAFLMVLPVVWSNVHAGITSVDNSLLEMAQLYSFSAIKKARYIYIPAVIPHFIAALRVSLGFAWKSGIAGEVIAIPAGAIGTQLYNSKIYLDSVGLFAWTGVIVALSSVLEWLLLHFLPKGDISDKA